MHECKMTMLCVRCIEFSYLFVHFLLSVWRILVDDPTTDKCSYLTGGFRVTGRMSTQCSLSDAISGELTVEGSAVPINSIDIHLLRVESILLGEKIITEQSLIQTTQVCNILLNES